MIELFRDDDISYLTTIHKFQPFHELFIKYKKTHTIAVLAEKFWDNKEICYYVATAPYLNIGLHGLSHKDYALEANKLHDPKFVLPPNSLQVELEEAKKYLEEHINKYRKEKMLPVLRITTFFPPWNRSNKYLEKECSLAGLKVDNRVGGEVVNLHYWSTPLLELEQILKIN